MRMIPGVLALLIVMTGAAWGAVQDPVHDFPDFYKIPEDYDGYYYYFNRYDYNFNYQLRDVSGVRDGHTIAGAQWFATVYENALWNNIYREEIMNGDERTWYHPVYRRTLGGEMPEIPMVTSADLLYDFESVYLNEPEPYPAATINDYWWIYSHDLYPDPVETLCLVIPEGRGEFDVSLANHYARHFPYWWKVDPHLGPNVPVNPANYTVPVYTLSNDVSGDAILDTAKTVVGYVDGSSIFNSTHTDVLYTVSTVSDDTNVLNASGDTVYKLVTSRDITYVYNPSGYCVYRVSNGIVYGSSFGRDVMEDVRMSAENYTISVNPNTPQRVAPTQSMTARIRLTAEDPESYGSTLGHIAFRQSASFDTGYTGWRESIQIPIVVANVHDGPASDPGNELYFDMMVFDRTPSFDVESSRDIYIINDIVNRIKFRWGVETDMTQDLGTFYMMGDTPVYHLETRVTNRTGTRYRLQRYDMISNPGNSPSSNPLSADTTGVRYTFRDIRPDRWQYDLTPDLYGSLPDYFQLDAHSQIAPGLVTVYKNRVGSGYNTLDTTYGTSESFRLYPFAEATHHDLRLSYRRVGGMTSTGGSSGSSNRWSVRGFAWNQFADVVQNDDQTERELELLMGKPASLGTGSVSAADTYIRSSALNAFEIKTPVPEGLVSMDVVAVVVSEDVSGDIVESRDVPATIAVQPMRVRLRIPRQEQMLVGHWAELDAAPDNKALLNQFLRFATIWLRSGNAYERDTNLFSAISNRSVDPTECVQAFLYENELYLDFMILLADAKSRNEGYTAYLETFRDDGIPYILIGDGAADGVWNLSLYVDSNGANPDWGYTSGDLTSRDKSDGEGGGGCSAGLAGIAAAAVAGAFFLRRRGY